MRGTMAQCCAVLRGAELFTLSRALRAACALALCANTALAQPAPQGSEVVTPPVPLATPEIPTLTPQAGVERTLFDLYLSDAFQGGVLANYTERWFEIEDPLAAIEQLKDFEQEKVDKLLPLLLGRIEGKRTIAGVGSISCDIYTFRILIELDANLLKSSSVKLSGRLPDPDGGLSLQQNLGLSAAGELGGDTDSAFSHRSVIGAGRFFGRINGAVLQNEPYELTEASAFGYLGDFEIGSGFLQSTGQAFANSLQYTGLRVRTSDRILLDPEEGRGSRLEVFIPSRSRVEFYRGGRLITVQLLDFGLQEINTATFPQGSYDIDVVITEANGNVIRDRKFFTKSGFLTVRGRPSYDFQLGALREEFSTGGTPLYSGGVQWRAADTTDLSASLYGDDERAISQLQLTGLFRENFLLASSSFSTDGDVGVNGSFSTSYSGYSLSLGGAKAIKVSEESQQLAFTPTPDPNDPPGVIKRSERATQLFFQDRESYSVNLSKSFGTFAVNYAAQAERFAEGRKRRSQGPSAVWNIYDRDLSALRYGISYLSTDQGDVLSNSLFHRLRLSERWNIASQLSHYHRDINNEAVAYLNILYDRRRRSLYNTRLNYTSENRRIDPKEGSTSSVFTNQLVGEYGGDAIYASGFLREQTGNNSGKSSFGVNAESAVLVSNTGSTAFSYPMGQDAVFIADLKGISSKTRFEVLLNDQVYDSVAVGRRSAISVHPFRTYRISIRPADPNELVDYDTSTYSLTFFPGNVIERSWSVEDVIIILGRLVNKSGAPIALQRIRGPRDYVATDEQGNFQAEISGRERLYVETKEFNCTIELGELKESEYFVDLGDVVCK